MKPLTAMLWSRSISRRPQRIKPDPFFAKDVARRISLGNFEDDLARVAEADWVVEAVVERLDIKRRIMQRVQEHVSDGAVVSHQYERHTSSRYHGRPVR